MAGMTQHPPEPLQVFRGLAEAVAAGLRDVEAAHARYREERDAGRILANSVEALRVELTYHSNAIEGSTLSLRETNSSSKGTRRPAARRCARSTRPGTTTGHCGCSSDGWRSVPGLRH